MRVAAIVEVPITNGGGFNQSMSTVLQLQRIFGDRHELVVYSTVKQDLHHIRRLGVDAQLLPTGLRDLWVLHSQAGPLLRKLRKRIAVESSLERELTRNRVDLAFFVGHSARPVLLEKIPCIATVWDLCHLDHPEFPEVGAGSEFFHREFSFSHTLSRAVAVMCASRSLAEKISTHYGVDRERLVVTPFSASPFLQEGSSTDQREALRKYDLQEGYYFYPAQFWPHKNHIRILQAMAEARLNGVSRRAVFCGSDHGNLAHIRSMAERLQLAEDVRILGFVPPEDMRALYEGAFAVLMPSYFGPTNIPPIEAWTCGIPLVCSRDMAEQVGRAALVIDADSVGELREALTKIEDASIRSELVQLGYERIRAVEEERFASEEAISRSLESFARRLECWKAIEPSRGTA